MYVYIFTRFYSYRHCTKVCVYLQTQHICFLGSWFLVQHSTFNTLDGSQQEMERWKLLLQHIFFKDGLPHSTNGNTLT